MPDSASEARDFSDDVILLYLSRFRNFFRFLSSQARTQVAAALIKFNRNFEMMITGVTRDAKCSQNQMFTHRKITVKVFSSQLYVTRDVNTWSRQYSKVTARNPKKSRFSPDMKCVAPPTQRWYMKPASFSVPERGVKNYKEGSGDTRQSVPPNGLSFFTSATGTKTQWFSSLKILLKNNESSGTSGRHFFAHRRSFHDLFLLSSLLALATFLSSCRIYTLPQPPCALPLSLPSPAFSSLLSPFPRSPVAAIVSRKGGHDSVHHGPGMSVARKGASHVAGTDDGTHHGDDGVHHSTDDTIVARKGRSHAAGTNDGSQREHVAIEVDDDGAHHGPDDTILAHKGSNDDDTIELGDDGLHHGADTSPVIECKSGSDGGAHHGADSSIEVRDNSVRRGGNHGADD
ncbi:hypothetical protein C8R43DRAFT_962192 [Mycena crocata]|nr:hypothetical protein C8R43DRAFT_962192 [Mycena crocata]